MAFPWAAAVTAGAGIGGTLIGAAGTAKQNHDARNFALMQGDIDWQRQIDAFNMQNERDDSTWNRQNDYNLDMWNRQNQYNSPAAQMARYKEAGLNPALIYGQSNTGGSVATANLDSGRIGGGGRPGNYTPAKVDYSGLATSVRDGILSYYDVAAKTAQIDNLKAANDVMQEDARLKSAQAAATLLGNAGIPWQNQLAQYNATKAFNESQAAPELSRISVDAAKASLRKITVDTDLATHRDVREAAQNSSSLQEAGARIQNLIKEGKVKDVDAALKQLDLQYKGRGQNFKDYGERTLGRFFQSLEQSGSDYLNSKESEKFKKFVDKYSY